MDTFYNYKLSCDNNNVNRRAESIMISSHHVPAVNFRLCGRVGTFSAVASIGIVAVNAVLWMVPQWAPLVARGTANLQLEPIMLAPVVRWIALIYTTLYWATLARGLWIAHVLFRRLSVGLVFEPETGSLLHRFGWLLVIFSGLTPLVSSGTAWLVTQGNPPGQRLLRLAISDHEIVLAIVGTLILTTGSAMAEAARIAEENRQIV